MNYLAASRMPLPPSPELRAAETDDDSWYHVVEEAPAARLRAVAHYGDATALAVSAYEAHWQTCLAAVAATDGVTVSRLDQLSRPLRRWPHRGTRALCFQGGGTTLWQGADRHVTAWDVAAGPLVARAPLPAPLVSLAADASSSSSSSHLLWACTQHVACALDIRQPTVAGSTKPVLRFGHTAPTTAPYVQMAADSCSEVALLDANGVLRLWDVRYICTPRSGSENNDPTATPLQTLTVHTGRGVGLQALSDQGWVVWGYDVHPHHSDPMCVTKIVGRSAMKMEGAKSGDADDELYGLAHVWETPHLACARVCGEHLVTLRTDKTAWGADVYRYRRATIEPVVSFDSAATNTGPLCASQLAWSTFGSTLLETGQTPYPQRTGGLLLVNLTQDGTLTTHSIPEAMESLPDIPTGKDDSEGGNIHNAANNLPSTIPASPIRRRNVSEDRDWSDVARAFRKQTSSTGDNTPQNVSEDGDMPFDMDVPVAYSIPSTDVQQALRRGVSAGAVLGTSPTAGTATPEGQDEAVPAVRVSVDTKRLPCPRLCGASFGPNGALVVFGNGQVHRMWSWYSSSAAVFQMTRGDKPPLRTMNDLQDMMKAAKDAQWGKQMDGEALSIESQQLGLGFFDDDSVEDDDSTESAEGEVEGLVEVERDKTDSMYENYFGDFRRPLTRSMSSGDEPAITRASSETDTSLGGPSSDMLAPVVKVTLAFEKTVMHGQSRQLALSWKLGEILLENDEPFASVDVRVPSESDLPPLVSPTVPAALSQQRFFLPGYRSLAPHLSRRQSLPGKMPNSKSEPLISPPRKSRLKSPYDMDEAGVHGGEYSVRPHMKESTVFLKKLINYQQESGGIAGSSGYRGLTSPPDGPMQGRPTRKAQPSVTTSDHAGPTKAGAYVLRRAMPTNNHVLEAMKTICEHNATVSEELGESEKATTWALLSQVVAGRMHISCSSHWNPKASFAVGSNMVHLILKYYENMGDVQMLATIVCVLRQEPVPTDGVSSILPKEMDVGYDGYLRRYADLLYCWGLLSLRADLNKRLRYMYEEREVFGLMPKPQTSTGITIFSECPRCRKPTTSNYCRACSDYAFRCTLCDMAVRGLFTVCNKCGHGGHISHLHEWFGKNALCPSGCGCRCTLVTSPVLPSS